MEDSQTYVGIVLAIVGNCVISVGLNLQKKAHNDNENEKSYTQIPMWWIGTILMFGGEIGNFTAFGFAQASLISPLGAVSVISNALIATFLLHEVFRVRDLVGILFAIGGDICIVLNSADKNIEFGNDELMQRFGSADFIVYIVALCLAVGLSLAMAKKYEKKTPFWDLFVCSLLGSVTTMCCKALSTTIRLTVQGHSQFAHGLPYILTILTAVTGVIQIRFLNKAMRNFGNNQVVPVYFVLFTLCSILGGAVLYQEFSGLPAIRIIGFFLGCILTFFGVYLLTTKRHNHKGDAYSSSRVRLGSTLSNISDRYSKHDLIKPGEMEDMDFSDSDSEYSFGVDGHGHGDVKRRGGAGAGEGDGAVSLMTHDGMKKRMNKEHEHSVQDGRDGEDEGDGDGRSASLSVSVSVDLSVGGSVGAYHEVGAVDSIAGSSRQQPLTPPPTHTMQSFELTPASTLGHHKHKHRAHPHHHHHDEHVGEGGEHHGHDKILLTPMSPKSPQSPPDIHVDPNIAAAASAANINMANVAIPKPRGRSGSVWDEFESRIAMAQDYAMRGWTVLEGAMDFPLNIDFDAISISTPEKQHVDSTAGPHSHFPIRSAGASPMRKSHIIPEGEGEGGGGSGESGDGEIVRRHSIDFELRDRDGHRLTFAPGSAFEKNIGTIALPLHAAGGLAEEVVHRIFTKDEKKAKSKSKIGTEAGASVDADGHADVKVAVANEDEEK